MLKYLIIFFFALNSINAFSQNKHQLNGIVFIDGKLAGGTGTFIFSNPVDSISFRYTYGDIIVDSLHYGNLIKRLKNNDSIEVVIQNQKKMYAESHLSKINFEQNKCPK